MSAEAAATQTTLTALNTTIAKLDATLSNRFKPLEKVTKQVSGAKFGKNVKAFGGAMKGMAAASVSAWGMQQIMKLIEPFMKLLKLLEIPINVLSALLTMMVNEIFVDLLPYFIDFSMLLMQLMPTFKIIGQVIGWFLTLLIDGLITGIKMAWLGMKAMVDWIIEIWPTIFGKEGWIVSTWQSIFGKEGWIATTWKDIFGKEGSIATALGAFKTKISEIWSNIFGKEGFFATLLSGVWNGIKTLWDNTGGKLFGSEGIISKALDGLLGIGKAIVNSFTSSINSVIDVINLIPGVDLGKIPMLAQGGITTGPTLAVLGDNPSGVERVQPLDNSGGFGKESQILSALEESNRLLTLQVRLLREEAQWRI